MPPSHRSFEDIAASVYLMAGKDAGEDRREHKRTPVKSSISALIYRSHGVPVTAQVRDLSRGGIGLLVPVAIRRDEEFTVTVNLGNGMLTLRCRVANCRLVDDRYIVGGQFVTIERKRKNAQPGNVNSQRSTAFEESIDPSELLPPDGQNHVRDVEQRLRKLMDDG
jgi:hypothetical protein